MRKIHRCQVKNKYQYFNVTGNFFSGDVQGGRLDIAETEKVLVKVTTLPPLQDVETNLRTHSSK